MSRIVCVTGTYDVYKKGQRTGETEFVVSHGVDQFTGRNVILPCEHPASLGARFDRQLAEWVIED